MPTRLTLVGHYTERRYGEISFGTSATTITLDGGLTVTMPRPFLPIGNELAVTPVLEPDGESGVRIDLARWIPMRYSGSGLYVLPFFFNSQDLAVKVARAFDADRRVTWQHTPAEVESWLREWCAANGVRF